MALQSVLFLPRTITHLNPRNPARMRIWGSIFSDEGKWGIRQLAFCPSKGYEMLVGFPFSIIGIRKRIWTIFYFRFSRAYNSRYEKRDIFSILKLSEINLIRAPIFSTILTLNRKKPVKPAFPFPVENTLVSWLICQNKADLHLAQCLPMALQSILFSPPNLGHKTWETLPERECEGRFFPTRII
jgi:hypothetical protein